MSSSDRGSFTDVILAEVGPHLPPLSCCRRALVAGMQLASSDPTCVVTTRLVSARAAIAAMHAEGITGHAETVKVPRRTLYRVVGSRPKLVGKTERSCCARSLLRGAFLVGGSMCRLDAPAHLEIRGHNDAAVQLLTEACLVAGIPATTAMRRKKSWLLVRSDAGVGTFLSSIGAHHGRLEFEEGRVVRELRGSVNRRLNAETANLRRTVGAALRQLEAIAALGPRVATLPPALREAALLRQRNPESSLEALAVAAGCSKSAISGRLHRLIEVAQDA